MNTGGEFVTQYMLLMCTLNGFMYKSLYAKVSNTLHFFMCMSWGGGGGGAVYGVSYGVVFEILKSAPFLINMWFSVKWKVVSPDMDF